MYNYVEFPGLSNPAGRFDLPQHAGPVHLLGWLAQHYYLTACGAACLPGWLASTPIWLVVALHACLGGWTITPYKRLIGLK